MTTAPSIADLLSYRARVPGFRDAKSNSRNRWTLPLLLIAVLGCQRTESPTLYPVSGQVILDGQPVPMIEVCFRPDESNGNLSQQIPLGVTDLDGKFELKTRGRQGAPPGWYKVVVWPREPDPTAHPLPVPKFDDKYLDLETTELRYEVKANSTPESCILQLHK